MVNIIHKRVTANILSRRSSPIYSSHLVATFALLRAHFFAARAISTPHNTSPAHFVPALSCRKREQIPISCKYLINVTPFL